MGSGASGNLGSHMRTMFAIYVLLITVGLTLYIAVGLAHL
jgi:hypothetical protein